MRIYGTTGNPDWFTMTTAERKSITSGRSSKNGVSSLLDNKQVYFDAIDAFEGTSNAVQPPRLVDSGGMSLGQNHKT